MFMDGLRILSLSTYDISGGAAKAAYRIHLGVRSLGVDSTMIVKNKRSNDETVYSLQEFLPHNFCYNAVDRITIKIKNKWQHYQWGKYPQREPYFMSDLRAISLHHALDHIEFDVLHLHWINQLFLPLSVLKKVKKPILWTLHDSWPFCGVCHYALDCNKYTTRCGACPHLHSIDTCDLSYKIWKRKQQLYKGLNLHIVTPSNWLAECARNSTLFRDIPVSVIPNCLDTNVYQPEERKQAAVLWNKDLKKKYILYGAVNATQDKIKGFEPLCEALKTMVHEYNMEDVELLVFGADKPLQQLELGMPVTYMGYISDEKKLASLYALADVMVVPSLTENLSYTIMESLACGTPVVAFSIGGNGDMIRHKVNGWLANDVYSMAEGINWLLDKKEKINGRKEIADVVQQVYSIKNVAEQYKNLYYSLC